MFILTAGVCWLLQFVHIQLLLIRGYSVDVFLEVN